MNRLNFAAKKALVLMFTLSCLYSMAEDINFMVSPSLLTPVDIIGKISRSSTTERKTVRGIAHGGQFGSASGILSGGGFPTSVVLGEYSIEPTSTSFSFASGGIFIPASESMSDQPLPHWSFTYKRDLFYFTSGNEKTIWLGGETSFSTNTEADWYISGIKKHTGKVFKIGQNWVPENPETYTIVAKDKTSNCEVNALLTVVRVSTLGIDATDASHAKITYKLEPSSISCEASLKIGSMEKDTKNVSGVFFYEFDQELETNTSFLLVLSNMDLSKKTILTSLSVNYVESTKDGHLHVWIALEGCGYRFLDWSATDRYIRYTYDCPASGNLIRFIPRNSSDTATSEAFLSLKNTGIEDCDYKVAFLHRFSDDQSSFYLKKNLNSLSSYWICRGYDFTSNKNKDITAVVEVFLSAYSGNTSVLSISAGSELELQIQ